ncbi:MAG TPA: tetratricopeptide repeat protein [Terracidiphilus sp.]|jgi:tetratricopeptide (TPR) repeat protein|nr:tetratricopeptide repeat protein [Terracidiphilus sp.]
MPLDGAERSRHLRQALAALLPIVALGVVLGWVLFGAHRGVVSGAMDAPAAVTVDYPLNQSVFPPDMEPPTFLWRDPSDRAATWKIDVTFASGGPALHIASDGPLMKTGEIDPRCVGPTNKLPELTPEQAAAHTWKPDAATWAAVRKYAVESAATISISGYAAGDQAQPLSRGQMQLTISRDPVGAPIFYRDVPLMPSATESGIIKPLAESAVPLINWRMRDVGQPQSHIVMNDLHSCANCHSFSRDGKTLGLDMDGPQNDKGLYALVPVAKEMTIRTQDMVSWASFRKELDPLLRVGFMSQVSPDGRYVVTTVKPPHTRSSQFYYVSNFADYRFLQVFYPTRGILAIYDRQTKTLKPLPGADDPSFVQASAVWSPDGKYIVFLRAEAKDPYRDDHVMAKFPNDPNEVQIQYDLYRIAFNGGQGGTPEPIEGASRNGMSNSFAKVSPDGKWIVFVEAKNGLLMRPDSKLYIIPAQGGTARLMNANTSLMNSWHSWSPNGRWLVFSSKSRSPYTQMFLTHVDEKGNDTPAILIENSTAANRAINIPEFVNMPPAGVDHIATPAVDFYKQYDVAAGLFKKGDYTAAIPEWRKALALEPRDPRALNGFGETLAKDGKHDEAMAQFRAAIAAKPEYVEAHNNLGILLASLGKPTEAVAEFNQALEISPGYADTRNNLGRLLLEQNRVPEAITQFQAAIEINPGFAEAHSNLGYAYGTQGHLDDAITEYRAAIDADPKFAHAYNNLGLALASQGKLDDAIKNFARAALLEPNYASAEANLGRALLDKGWPADAVKYLQKALDLGPESAEVHDNLGLALAQSGHVPDAIPHFRRALALAPGLNEARYYLGEALVGSGQAQEGLAQWREGLRKEPDNLQLLNDTAWTLATARDASLRNGSEALTLSQHAVQLSGSRQPEFLATLAAAYAETGQFAQAVETEQHAADVAAQQGNTALAQVLTARLALLQGKTPIRQ